MKAIRWCVAAVCLAAVIGLAGCASSDGSGGAIQVPQKRAASRTANVSPLADGVAFVQGSHAWVVRSGSLVDIGPTEGGVVAVGYSADRAHLLVVADKGGSRVVTAVPATSSAPVRQVLVHDSGSILGTVRMPSGARSVFYSEYGAPDSSLFTADSPNPDRPSPVKLAGSFSGEFDVARTSSEGPVVLVFSSSSQNPATLTLKRGTKEAPLVTTFATAFTPAFAGDGNRVCFTGSEHAGEPVSLWVVGTTSGKPERVGGTEGLTPTYPVFAADGRSIAFRNADDGLLWAVDVVSDQAVNLGIVADEAPIGW